MNNVSQLKLGLPWQTKGQLLALKLHSYILSVENWLLNPIRKLFDGNTNCFVEDKKEVTSK